MTEPGLLQHTTINGQTVKLVVVAASGLPDLGPLTTEESRDLSQIDRRLQSDAHFREKYPKARLERVDSMRGIPPNECGRYYLLYRYQGGLTEFWGGLGEQEDLDLEQGLVRIAKLEQPERSG